MFVAYVNTNAIRPILTKVSEIGLGYIKENVEITVSNTLKNIPIISCVVDCPSW